MYVCAPHVPGAHGGQKNVSESPGSIAGVTGGFLDENSVLLTTETSLQPQDNII